MQVQICDGMSDIEGGGDVNVNLCNDVLTITCKHVPSFRKHFIAFSKFIRLFDVSFISTGNKMVFRSN